MGFAAFLMAAGVVTLRTGVLARWTGIVALIGAVAFLITFLTVIDGTGDGSVFGYAFFPAILSLVTWTIATSEHRQIPRSGGGEPAIARAWPQKREGRPRPSVDGKEGVEPGTRWKRCFVSGC
jgi:hypothetical protein